MKRRRKKRQKRHILIIICLAVTLCVPLVYSIRRQGTRLVLLREAITLQTSKGRIRLSAGMPLIARDRGAFSKVTFFTREQETSGLIAGRYLLNYHFDESFEEEISSFPETYKQTLRYCHQLYPQWRFQAFATMSWQQALDSYRKKALIDSDDEALIASKRLVEGKKWRLASQATVAYYLDPRQHFLPEDILMFEKLTFNEHDTLASASAMLAGTAMAGIDQTSGLSYAKLYYDASRKYSMSLSNIIVRALQEAGKSSLSQGARGVKLADGKTYYNLFNIGARSGTMDGIDYARKMNWTTRQKAIDGGVRYLATYMKSGQESLYLQRFDLRSSKPGTHAYMTNITAPASEARTLYQSLSSFNVLDKERELDIPVFSAMPLSTSYPASNKEKHVSLVKEYKELSSCKLRYDPYRYTLKIYDGKRRLRPNIDYAYIHDQDHDIVYGLNGYLGRKELSKR